MPSPSDVRLIEDQAALEEFAADISSAEVIAVDTEFFRETTYFPKLGLVQIASLDHLACIDPLAFDARTGLRDILLDRDTTKLFHSCSQDLEVMLQYLGELPCPIIDTQIAAAMLGDRDQVSYANIVAEQLDVHLEKSQTRTNWLKRPLSHKQLEYAAEDVLYLIPLYELLLEQLQDKDRLHWLQHDCAALCENIERFEPDFDSVWLRVKGTQRLKPEQLAVVDASARWREHKAIAMNLTRKQVISDDFIINTAINRPDTIEQLQQQGKAHRRLDRQDYSALHEEIRQALGANPESWPSPPRFRLSNEEKNRIRQMMSLVESKATELGIAQAVLGSRKEIEKLVNGRRDLNILGNWRQQVIGDELLSQIVS